MDKTWFYKRMCIVFASQIHVCAHDGLSEFICSQCPGYHRWESAQGKEEERLLMFAILHVAWLRLSDMPTFNDSLLRLSAYLITGT